MSEGFLLVRFSSLGDCVLACPLAAALAAEAPVTVMTRRDMAPVFAAAEGVDRVLAVDRRAGLRELVALARRARGLRVVDAHASLRSRIVSAVLGGAEVRFPKHYAARLGLIALKRNPRLPTILETYADLARAVGVDVDTLRPGGIVPGDAARRRAARELEGRSAPRVAVAPGARWPDKRWPHFAQLVERLADRAAIVVVGDAADARAFDTPEAPHVDLAGALDLIETAAVLEACDLLVCNDSGLLHLAEAVGTPVVALFGPTVEAFGYFPALEASRVVERALPCRPCSRNGSTPCPRGDRACLRAIDVETVERVVEDALAGRGPRRVVVS